ncbi:thioredoxin [Galbitalea soli]|nr:thioredoxin [Galbitalea soli]NYJ30356.1 protein-disulfide isomerase [Galbitalea soli]
MVTRTVLADAARLVPGMTLAEHDVVLHEAEAEARGVRSAPTVIVSDGNGGEVFRAEGIPTLNQVLVALAKAV